MRYEPTDEQRKTVKAMAAFGVPQPDIASVVGCSEKTLRKHYRHELDIAQVEANTRVAQTCFQMATSGNCPAATFFWLKTRAGWREKGEAAPQDAATPFIIAGPGEGTERPTE